MSSRKPEAQVPATRELFKDFEDHNKLLPTETYYEHVGPMQRVSIETVHISEKVQDGDVYKLEEGKYPLTKRGLEKIAHAAGISFHPEFSKVEEHRDSYCRYKAVGAMRKADGTLQVVTGTYFIDLEADRKSGMTEKRLKQRRQFIVQLCESGAKNRAIRSLLGLKSNYAPNELKKPFAVPRIDFSPDLSDPAVKQFLLQQATQATVALYPPQGQPIQAEHKVIESGEAEPEPTLDDVLGESEPTPEDLRHARIMELETMSDAELRNYFKDLVFEYKYDYHKDPDGIVQLFRDGKKCEAIADLEAWEKEKGGGEDV